jgi:5-methyltetrahydropteroyltriglutamate--homocysteine methyltransferase
MNRSTERILTTHVGSLPRPPDLLDMIQVKGSFDAAAFAARVKSAVADVVRRQAEAGIDIIADGEMGRLGFIPYVNERLTGLEARSNPRSEGTWARSREHLAFPEYYAWAAQTLLLPE